ncbi:MAG: VCBS repeat-containing protein [Enhygromyxa sp.]
MTSTKPLLPLLAGITTLLLCDTAGAVPYVDLIAGALDPQPCNGQGCWTNHLRVTDIDGDGDLDILLANYGDFFQGNNAPQPLVVYQNDGNGDFTNVSASAVGNYSGNLRMIAVGDVDGDGYPDIYGPSGTGSAHVLFMNDGTGQFVDEADLRLPNDYPQSGAARMGDVDGDGDLDIFAADGYANSGPPYGRLYINDGTGMFEEAVGAIPDSISGYDIDDVEFVDVDRDFDLDLIVNAHAGGTGALWLNDGTGTFSPGGTLAPPGPGSNYHYNVAPCDVDGDGDLDLWIDNTGGSYTEQLQINDGNGNFTDETAQRVSGNPTGSDDNGVVCVDIDDDGDFDAVIVALGSPERLLINDGNGNFTLQAQAFPGPTDCSLWAEFGDLDGDHRLDLVTGQGECPNASTNKLYMGNGDQPQDSTAPKIIAVSDVPDGNPGDTIVALFAVSDRTVTDEGPQQVRAFAVVTDTNQELPAKFVGGDLFRVELPSDALGTVSVELCAEDGAGNLGCSDPVSYEIGEGSGDGDGDGDPSGDGDGDEDPSGDGDGDPSGDTDGDPSGEDEEKGETGGPALDDEGGGGCSCSLADPEAGAAKRSGGLGWSLLSLFGLGLLIRRRS